MRCRALVAQAGAYIAGVFDDDGRLLAIYAANRLADLRIPAARLVCRIVEGKI